MTRTLGLYLCGQRGFQSLFELVQKATDFKILFVVTTGDAGLTRDYAAEIETLCLEQRLSCFRREADEKTQLPRVDLAFAIGWRWLIRDCPNLLVLHDSLLPRYRGFSPLVCALINGDKEIGASALVASEVFDEGPIVKQLSARISYPIKVQVAIDIVSKLCAELCISICKEFLSFAELKHREQDSTSASFSPWRDSLDYIIPWHQSASYISRFCDAVGSPYGEALTYWGARGIRIQEVRPCDDVQIEDRDRHLGKVIFKHDLRPCVICGEGIVEIMRARFEDNGLEIFEDLPFRVRFTQKANPV